MFTPNGYIAEKNARQHAQELVREAERERMLGRLRQPGARHAPSRGPWPRRLSWAGRLLSALLGAW